MYFITNMAKEINDSLYRDFLSIAPTLKSYLPFTVETTHNLDKILFILDGIRTEESHETQLLLRDLRCFFMYGHAFTPESELGTNLKQNLQFVNKTVSDAFYHSCKKHNYLFVVSDILRRYDDQACLVGGSIRDILQSKEPKDFDFVSSLDYDKLIKIFTDHAFTVKENGKQFLVLTVSKGGENYEIACFRADSTYSDGRRPDSVTIGNIETDSARRDFTVNALYYNIKYKTVLDPTGKGIDDSFTKTLRFIGSPKARLQEDWLRGIRFYRFISKGFTPEAKSLKAVRELFPTIIARTDSERIRVELERIVGV